MRNEKTLEQRVKELEKDLVELTMLHHSEKDELDCEIDMLKKENQILKNKLESLLKHFKTFY